MAENLCCSICEALPIPVDFTELKSLISDKRTIVLGSAPSAQDDLRDAYQAPSDCLICINGSVGAVSKDTPIDILFLNSQDISEWTPEGRWLHRLMMRQLAGRHIRHIVFLMKTKSPQNTIEELKDLGTSWDSSQTVCSMPKIELCQSVGIKNWRHAFNCSAGVFAVSTAVIAGSSPIMLCGFSFNDGYCYFPTTLTGTRKHKSSDQYSLNFLALRYPRTLLVKASILPSTHRLTDCR